MEAKICILYFTSSSEPPIQASFELISFPGHPVQPSLLTSQYKLPIQEFSLN